MLPSRECKHILPLLPMTESQYSDVVPLSVSDLWSNRGGGGARREEPIPNHNKTINSHFSGYLLSRLGGGTKVLFQLHAVCPQRQPKPMYGADETRQCDLL